MYYYIYLCNSDYGYQHTDGFTGPCIRDMSIKLSDPCIENHTIYKKTQGYRKIAGDVCMGGEEAKFGAGDALCCENGRLICTMGKFSLPHANYHSFKTTVKVVLDRTCDTKW